MEYETEHLRDETDACLTRDTQLKCKLSVNSNFSSVKTLKILNQCKSVTEEYETQAKDED